jgi:hypothetical protein
MSLINNDHFWVGFSLFSLVKRFDWLSFSVAKGNEKTSSAHEWKKACRLNTVRQKLLRILGAIFHD